MPVLGGSRFLSGVEVSRDGQWLACYVVGNQLDLLLSRSDGTGGVELARDATNDRNPTWSADGRLIAFFSNRSGKNQIWSIRPDGSQLRPLTFAAEGVSSCNIWSPDGSRMIYEGQGADVDKWFIFEPGIPWSAQTPQRFSRVIEPGILFSPWAWSPDGAKVLGFVSNGGIYSFAFAAARFSKLLDRGDVGSWLNDSRRALVHNQGRLYVLDTASTTIRELFSVAPDEFDNVTISSDNRTIYFTRASEQGDLWLATIK